MDQPSNTDQMPDMRGEDYDLAVPFVSTPAGSDADGLIRRRKYWFPVLGRWLARRRRMRHARRRVRFRAMVKLRLELWLTKKRLADAKVTIEEKERVIMVNEQELELLNFAIERERERLKADIAVEARRGAEAQATKR